MPVLGHAFAGLAIGVSTRPAPREEPGAPGGESAAAFWLPAVVALAYLPDIVAQLGLLAGWDDGRLLGHSVLFAPLASLAMAPTLMRLTGGTFGRALVTALVSILVHDGLDLLQATDRAPWWPLSSRPMGSGLGLLPTGFLPEAGLFGAGLLALLALGRGTSAGSSRSKAAPRGGEGRPARWVWPGRALVGAIVLVAALTHTLRDARESQLEAGRALVGQREYRAALEALDRAGPWPSTARPGRIDYLRAEAHAGLGDRARAEAHYLRAYRADPSYFWVVADLALFYAGSDAPDDERRRLTEPYLSRLRRDFAGHEALPQAVTRVERKLSATSPAAASTRPPAPAPTAAPGP